jgi:hypothetical protein
MENYRAFEKIGEGGSGELQLGVTWIKVDHWRPARHWHHVYARGALTYCTYSESYALMKAHMARCTNASR